jgi:hypothetical protein
MRESGLGGDGDGLLAGIRLDPHYTALLHTIQQTEDIPPYIVAIYAVILFE